MKSRGGKRTYLCPKCDGENIIKAKGVQDNFFRRWFSSECNHWYCFDCGKWGKWTTVRNLRSGQECMAYMANRSFWRILITRWRRRLAERRRKQGSIVMYEL